MILDREQDSNGPRAWETEGRDLGGKRPHAVWNNKGLHLGGRFALLLRQRMPVAMVKAAVSCRSAPTFTGTPAMGWRVTEVWRRQIVDAERGRERAGSRPVACWRCGASPHSPNSRGRSHAHPPSTATHARPHATPQDHTVPRYGNRYQKSPRALPRGLLSLYSGGRTRTDDPRIMIPLL